MQQILINGVWAEPAEAPSRSVENPATLQRLGTVAECGAPDIARAVAAARAALPAWHWTPTAVRAQLIDHLGSKVRTHTRELASMLSGETGMPICEALDCVAAVATVFESAAALAVPPARPGISVLVPPSDFPLLFMANALAFELASGRTVVCQPSRHASLASLLLAQSFAALPPGVVNVITGGSATARDLYAQAGAAAAPAPDTNSYRGVDAFMVCRDADLDLAVPAIAWTRLFHAGQPCSSSKHVYVDRTVATEFVDRMHPCVGFLDVDDPQNQATDIGPLLSLSAAHLVEDQVGRALRDGARLILGGRRFSPSGLPGHFFQPTILADVPAGSPPTREAILGPAITVTPVSGLEEALRFAQQASPGKGFSVYTRDAEAATQALDRIASGIFFINDPVLTDAGPFGVLRDAGLRRAFGIASGPEHAPIKTVHAAERLAAKAWWFPYVRRPIVPAS